MNGSLVFVFFSLLTLKHRISLSLSLSLSLFTLFATHEKQREMAAPALRSLCRGHRAYPYGDMTNHLAGGPPAKLSSG